VIITFQYTTTILQEAIITLPIVTINIVVRDRPSRHMIPRVVVETCAFNINIAMPLPIIVGARGPVVRASGHRARGRGRDLPTGQRVSLSMSVVLHLTTQQDRVPGAHIPSGIDSCLQLLARICLLGKSKSPPISAQAICVTLNISTLRSSLVYSTYWQIPNGILLLL